MKHDGRLFHLWQSEPWHAGCAGRRSRYPSPTLRFVSTMISMARLLRPRSGVGGLVIQVVVLAVAVGAVYRLVLMLGSGL